MSTLESKIAEAARQEIAAAAKKRAILTVLAQSPFGSTKSRLAILSGYSSSGGGFNNYLASLRTRGLIQGAGDPIRITDAGRTFLGPFEELPRGEERVAYWLSRLDKAERSIIEVLVREKDGLSKEELASRAGYQPTGGGFNNALSRLRTIELIEGRAPEPIRATDALTE